MADILVRIVFVLVKYVSIGYILFGVVLMCEVVKRLVNGNDDT